jgi:hypothetical protein
VETVTKGEAVIEIRSVIGMVGGMALLIHSEKHKGQLKIRVGQFDSIAHGGVWGI